MSKLIIPKTTTAYRETAVPKAADLLFDTDINKMVIGDGVTPGGIVINASGGTASSEVTGGYGINVVNNEVSLKRFDAIESLVSGGTVQAGHAYNLNATSSSGTTIYAEWFANGTFARDPAHIEIMVNGVGYLHLGQNTTAGSETAPFVLVGALEPDAMNNVTVRFHDGVAVMTVEDHVGGYVVISGGTSQSTAGTLPYALVNTGSDASPYITFSSELNGTTFDVTGVTVTTERHVVGNGYDETKITGDVNVGTSGTLSMAAVGLQNVVVSSGTLTLGDAYIPSGSTVAVSGGGLAVEKVTGNGGVIDLGNTRVTVPYNTSAIISGCVISGGSAAAGAGVGQITADGARIYVNNCVFAPTSAGQVAAIATRNGYGNNYVSISGCTFGLTATGPNVGAVNLLGNSATADIHDCVFGEGNLIYCFSSTAQVNVGGTLKYLGPAGFYFLGKMTVSSGATIDLTGNTNATPIAPGGGVIVDGGCQVITSAGTTVSIAGGTYTKINNDGTTE